MFTSFDMTHVQSCFFASLILVLFAILLVIVIVVAKAHQYMFNTPWCNTKCFHEQHRLVALFLI